MGKAFSGGMGNKNYANDFAQTLALISNMQYNQERSKYYGEAKESEIATRQANVDTKQAAELQKERERQFESATGRKYEPGDEAYMGGTTAALKSIQGTPVRGAPRQVGGFLGIGTKERPGDYVTDPSTGRPFVNRETVPGETLATGPSGSPDTESDNVSPYAIKGLPTIRGQKELQQAQTEIPQRMAIESYRRAQTLGMTNPYLDADKTVINPNYNPEIIAQIRQGNVRPDELVKRAEDIYKMRGAGSEARSKDVTATNAEEIARLTRLYEQTQDPRAREEIVKRVTMRHGQGMETLRFDEEKQKNYLAAANGAAKAMEEMQKTQTATPDNVDLIAQQAQAVTVHNLAMSRITNSPMTKIATMTPYNKLNPIPGILGRPTVSSKTTLVNVPTEFARAHTDGTLENLIRAPLNPNDPDNSQISQMQKQGQFFAWKLVQQNPELLGNPGAFNRAVEQSDIVRPEIKEFAKQHMGLYMASNPNERAETNIPEEDKQGPPAPPQIALPTPKGGIAGFEPPAGQAGFSPKDVVEPIKKFLPGAPKGGMFGTDFDPNAAQEPAKVIPEPTERPSLPTLGVPSIPGASASIPPAPQQPQKITPPKMAPLGPPPGADSKLVDAIIKVESSNNPNAVGPKGEGGLMQLREGTAKDMGISPQERFDATKNKEAGTKYISQLVQQFGSTEKALAAYNWGMGNMDKLLTKYGDRWMDAPELPNSTKDYIKKVMRIYKGSEGMLGVRGRG